MPLTGVETVQLKVVTTPETVADPFGEQTAALDTGPEVITFINPFGAVAPTVPVTTAVKISEPPNVGVEVLETVTVGITGATLTPGAESEAVPAL